MSRLAPVLGVVLLAACSDAPSDETPRGALTMFLSAMERSAYEREALREAYGLLSAASRRALLERAHDAQAYGAADVDPWDMIVPGRYRQTFTPARGARGMRERVEGDRATVVVTNQDGSRQAEVPLVREDGRWRVVLNIPSVR